MSMCLFDLLDFTFKFVMAISNELHVFSYRSQYEQFLDILKSLSPSFAGKSSSSFIHSLPPSRKQSTNANLGPPSVVDKDLDIEVEDQGIAMFEGSFEVPRLTLEIEGESVATSKVSSVVLECQDFAIKVEKKHKHDHAMEIALRRLTVEDLSLPVGDNNRMLATSLTSDNENTRYPF